MEVQSLEPATTLRNNNYQPFSAVELFRIISHLGNKFQNTLPYCWSNSASVERLGLSALVKLQGNHLTDALTYVSRIRRIIIDILPGY